MEYSRLKLFELGFRPFYLLAALWSVVTIAEWLLELQGTGFRSNSLIGGMQWHAHEMIFGFATTVITGFSLTAVKNWTGLDTPKNFSLFSLVLLWIGGRVGALYGSYWVLLDIVFLPTIAIVIGRLLFKKELVQSFFMPGVLIMLGMLNAMFYLGTLKYAEIEINNVLFASLYLIIMLEILMGNRIIPSFTKNALIGIIQLESKLLTKSTILISALTFGSIILGINTLICAIGCFLSAGLHSALLWGWRPLGAIHKPILGILHLSYAWIPVGFVFMGVHMLGFISIYPALHVFGIGATGGLIISMITRTALAHTGRPVVAGVIELVCYCCIQLALIAWLTATLQGGSWFFPILIIAALGWCGTFALYLYKYTPFLIFSRI